MEDARAQRRDTLAVVALAVLIGIVLVGIGPASSSRTATVAAGPMNAVAVTEPTASTTTATTPATTAPATTAAAAADPGALPQTDEQPTATGATFTAGVNGLWEAIRQDRPELGLPFFFPQKAYLQVKAISDPATDYQQRLIANFDDDVHTLHAQLGANAASAELIGISVPDNQAVLVQPGEESNKLSYWRVYGTTMQYRAGGQTGSFPVTSLISWRGQWYVVHLGAIR